MALGHAWQEPKDAHGVAAAADPTTRQGPRGQTLISTGLSDLDKVLGGGLPLGCLLLLEEKGPSPHADNLIRLFVAQGAACGHRTLWLRPRVPAGRTPPSLPALYSGKLGSHVRLIPSRCLLPLRLLIGYRSGAYCLSFFPPA